MACEAGQPTARKMPVPSRNAYVSGIGPSVNDTQASPRPDSASPTWLIRMSVLRGYRSAAAPAGSASSSTGSASTSPISPRLSGVWVRW